MTDFDAISLRKSNRHSRLNIVYHRDCLCRLIQDLRFQSCDIAAFNTIHQLRGPVLQRRKKELISITTSLNALLHERQIHFVDIHGRIKGVYSTYRKMMQRNMDINRIYDLVAVRIIAGDEDMCYRTLKALHDRYSPVEGRLKDYIAEPKTNGYKSLHTSLKGAGDAVFEVQIRTPQMHNVAEYGSAAHWLYDLAKENQLKRTLPAPEKNVLTRSEYHLPRQRRDTSRRQHAARKLEITPDTSLRLVE
ncbi:MAG TPA: hypothetical protein VJ969_11410 [Desulfopila sp.]|nr:hypothetical protein [Desulfopila sp.]